MPWVEPATRFGARGMKNLGGTLGRALVVLLLTVLLCSCVEFPDNESTVRLELDDAGCLVAAFDFDWTSETKSPDGSRIVNYNWECAEYKGEIEKKVLLTFAGTSCLTLSAEIVSEGLCLGGKTPPP